VNTVSVTRSVNAACTDGSRISGLAVATNRSVSATWLCTHTVASATGASRQPSTISTAARIDRQLNRRRRRAVRRVATSPRSRSSSARSSTLNPGPGAGSCVAVATPPSRTLDSPPG
jgi:hypothetical protein